MGTSSRQFKDTIYENFARIGKALSAPKRIEILDLLCQSPCSVELISERIDISVANASKHLQILKAARLVESQKLGVHVEYRIANRDVSHFFHAFRCIGEGQLSEINATARSFLVEREALDAVDTEELLRRIETGNAILIDVRPEPEFLAGHIPGAVSVPISELKSRLKDLPKDREIVAYCRGPYCVMAIEAVSALRKRGFTAHRMDLGILDWQILKDKSRMSPKDTRT